MTSVTLHRVPRRRLTTRPDLRGTFGMTASHPLARDRDRRRRCSSGAATPSTPRSRRAFVLHLVEPHLNGPGGDMTRRVRDGRRRRRRSRADGPGPRARRRRPSSTSAPRASTSCPGAGGARRRRARRGRRVAAAAARPRHVGAAPTCWPTRSGYAARRPPARRARRRDDRVGARAVPRALADLRRPLAARRRHPRPAPATLDDQPRVGGRCWRGLLDAGDAGAEPARAADRARPATAWATGRRRRRRSTRSCAPRTGTPTGADHAGVIRAADLAAFRAALRAGGHRRVPRADGRQDRRRGARGRCCCRRSRSSSRSPDDAARPVDRAGAHTMRRGAEARAGRPGGLVRRPDAGDGSAGAARRCCSPTRVRGRRRRALIGDARLRTELRPGAVPGAATPSRPPLRRSRSRRPAIGRGRRASRPCRADGRDPRRHLPPRRRRPLGQHRLGDAVAAAGCSRRRRSPSSASASAPGCRWRGSRRAPPSTLGPGAGRARR